MHLPELVYHADWSAGSAKRWAVRAVLSGSTYVAQAPERVLGPETLLARLGRDARGGVFAGFDFPIGVPLGWASNVGVRDFRELLPTLGSDGWAEFFEVAERPEDISLQRPFYPRRPGGTSHAQLIEALGVKRMDDLRRRCDLAAGARRAAAPIFWTLGGNQVGRAALAGWKQVLQPALRSDLDVRLWPFDGELLELLQAESVVVAETYPTEFYGHLGVRLGPEGKTKTTGRRPAVAMLERRAQNLQVELKPDLQAELSTGFADDDRFDAFVGLLGMINVVLGNRSSCEPRDSSVRAVEGWMLGQQW